MAKIDRFNRLAPAIATVILWLLTAVLGILSLLSTRGVALRTYLGFFPLISETASASQSRLALVNIVVTLIMSFFLIAVTIGGGEYHYRRVGQRDSWRLFGRTLAIELSLLALALFL